MSGQPPFDLRPFEPADAPAVRAIVAGVLASYGLATDPATDADLVDIERSYAGGRFYVLAAGSRVVGCGGLHVDPDGERAEIRKMYFLPEARGHGLGKRLLARLLGDARALGVRTVHLETNRVLAEAIALYRRSGFVEASGPHLSPRCDLYMKKDLEAEPCADPPRS